MFIKVGRFEFFVAKRPVHFNGWEDDSALLQAIGRRRSCLWGWPSSSLLGPDLEPVSLSASELALLEAVERQPKTPLGELNLGPETISVARGLLSRRLLLLEA